MRGSRTIRRICAADRRTHDAFGPPWFGCYNENAFGRGQTMILVALRHSAAPHHAARTTSCVVALAAVLSGCTSIGSLTGSSASAPAPTTTAAAPPSAPPASSSSSSFTSRVKNFFTGDSGTTLAAAPAAPGVAPSPDINCPAVDYRQGAATLSVNAPNTENSALSLRYQGSFVQTARECIVRGSELTIKVGVQGRIVIGPAGASGTVSVPLRYALVREGLEPRTLWTQLYNVPVAIPDGQLNIPFIHVEEEMKVPIPSSSELDAYVIYIGFDPDAAAPAQKPKPAVKPKSGRPKS